MPKSPMRNKIYRITFVTIVASLICCGALFSQPQIAKDNFEGNSTIHTWFGDDCILDTSFNNPYPTGINTSSKVLKYADVGGQYANVRFDANFNLNLSISSQFSLKIYVPSSGITGSQNNQISLKLQNGLLASPWQTQCEIIKPIVLNQWQTITFDFATDPFINFNSSSPNPIDRSDFSRVLIQINGENNNSNVLAFIDDFLYVSAFSAFNKLVWSDEFDSSGAVNNSNWFHQTQLPNGISWYNGELQHYTNQQSNSFVSNGVLNIVAKKETFTNQLQTKQYTSARLNSKFAFKYGRVEVRAKLPAGAGTWPAIWMLGKNIIEPGGYWNSTNGSTNWPACGEIDIMEHWGTNQNVVSSAVHFPINGNLNVGQYVTNAQYKAGVSSDFHIYAVEWNEQKIVLSVDGINHLTYSPSIKNQYTWPFDAEQYILLNVAIESSVANSFVESAMEVDYVRVYQKDCSPTSSTSTVSACGSYIWNGNSYSSGGTYTKSGLINAIGCDSIATLNLTINPNFFGNIMHPTQRKVTNVDINYNGTTSNFTGGKYNYDCVTAGTNITVKPTKNNDITKANGVTSVDALLTQRHILNVTKLNSPYKIIAADVNGDKAINSVDVLRIKRLILGTDTTFNSSTKGNRLWEFVDSAYVFPDTTNPFPFKDSISFTNLTSNKTNQTFIGVKLGDVNYDWNPAVAKQSTVNSIQLTANVDLKIINGELRIPISVNNFNDIAAMQYTLHFDNTKYEFVRIENNKLSIDFNEKQAVTNGNIAMLWTDKNAQAKTLEDGTELFVLVLRSTVDRQQSTDLALSIDNSITNVEAWDKDFIQHNIVLVPRTINDKPQTINEILIYPNPANNIVTIDCRNAKRIVIVDAIGRNVYDKNVINSQSSIINVKQFVKGIYIVQASLKDGNIINQKLIVE